jgi:hypothetical protein
MHLHYFLENMAAIYARAHSDAWLVKMDASGNMEWSQTYGGAESDVSRDLIKTMDGGYALAGGTTLTDDSGDFWLVKTDASGNMEWSQTYERPESELAYSLVEAHDGGYVLTGTTQNIDWPDFVGDDDVLLMKVDETGNVDWSYS